MWEDYQPKRKSVQQAAKAKWIKFYLSRPERGLTMKPYTFMTVDLMAKGKLTSAEILALIEVGVFENRTPLMSDGSLYPIMTVSRKYCLEWGSANVHL